MHLQVSVFKKFISFMKEMLYKSLFKSVSSMKLIIYLVLNKKIQAKSFTNRNYLLTQIKELSTLHFLPPHFHTLQKLLFWFNLRQNILHYNFSIYIYFPQPNNVKFSDTSVAAINIKVICNFFPPHFLINGLHLELQAIVSYSSSFSDYAS